jgi:hypothetical protein
MQNEPELTTGELQQLDMPQIGENIAKLRPVVDDVGKSNDQRLDNEQAAINEVQAYLDMISETVCMTSSLRIGTNVYRWIS